MVQTFSTPKFLRNFTRNRSGASAIEFALLAPLMIGLYLGTVEISEGVAAYRKVTLTAGALANLTSQVTGISAADKDNILQASIAIMEPFQGGVAAKVSCVKIDAAGVAKIAWGFATSGVTARATGENATVPADLRIPGSSLIWSEVSYLYHPVTGFSPGFSYIAATGKDLSDEMFMSPRITPPVYDAKSCS
jgi:Flp pilus assembly protein TadG